MYPPAEARGMDPGVRPKTVDLAREPDFALGGLEVSPATLETRAGERRVAGCVSGM